MVWLRPRFANDFAHQPGAGGKALSSMIFKFQHFDYSGMHLNEIQNLPKKLYTLMTFNSVPYSLVPVPCYSTQPRK